MADFKHFILEKTATTFGYTKTGGGGGDDDDRPLPDCRSHGDLLLKQLKAAERDATDRLRKSPIGQGMQFIPVEFEENSVFGMALDRLETEKRGIRIISARRRGGRVRYMVAVPDQEVEHFVRRFTAYRDSPDDAKKKNEELARGIQTIQSVDLADYWMDADEQLPPHDEVFWWEVWLSDEGKDDVAKAFRAVAGNQRVQLSEESVRFPERVVILARTSFSEWLKFPGLLQYLAEFRRANTITGEFLALPPSDQSEYIDNFLGRCTYASTDAPAVCILDRGVNRGHPLLKPALSDSDTQAWRPEWTPADLDGHGTEMAGLALFGDLADKLESLQPDEF